MKYFGTCDESKIQFKNLLAYELFHNFGDIDITKIKSSSPQIFWNFVYRKANLALPSCKISGNERTRLNQKLCTHSICTIPRSTETGCDLRVPALEKIGGAQNAFLNTL